jgi:hypothetical protein
MRPAVAAMILCGLAAAGGCHAVGPMALRTGRGPYSLALQQSTNEQLLLNLVRMHYRDTPIFFEVASVSCSYNEQVGLGGSFSPTRGDSFTNVYGLTGSAAFSEQPTIVYVPMQSERFAKQMLSPVSADALLLLTNSGWSLRRVLSLCVQRMNGLQNAPRASGPTPTWAPEYKDFQRASELMLELQLCDALRLDAEPQPGGASQVVLRFEPCPERDLEIAEIRRLLGLNPERKSYPVVLGGAANDPNFIALDTRSVLAAMHYLSQGVEVPKEDIARGKVTQTLDFKTRAPFDWQAVLKDVFRVRSQAHEPAQPAVAVKYRGVWFYVDDADLDSKSTFDMLTQLMALQAGDIRSVQPVLTIPVAR